jgi:type I restriction enzyme S subunit
MDWGEQKLSLLCDMFTDGDWVESKDQSAEGIRLIQTGNVGEGVFKNRRDKSRFISEDTFNRLKCTEIIEGDCLVSRLPDPVGRSCLIPNTGDRMITAVDCTIIRLNKSRLLPEFFTYFTQSYSYLKTVESLTSGATRTRISRKNLGEVPIPLPPIPEQQRIVAILDQAFADIEKARANAEKNLKNILELYLSNKQEIFGRSNPESQMMDLTSVCEGIFAGGDAPKKGLYSKVKTDKYKIPIYANAVKDAGLYGFTDYFRVDKPSITIAARGSGTGHIELRRYSFLPIVRLIVLIPRTGILSLEYFKYALQNLDILRSGSAIPQLTVPMIKEYCIPVPSLDTQLAIIEEIDRVGGYIEECKRLYEQKLQSLDELKKSLLQKAFSGELTKTEDMVA